jgi:hypothetical protein
MRGGWFFLIFLVGLMPMSVMAQADAPGPEKTAGRQAPSSVASPKDEAISNISTQAVSKPVSIAGEAELYKLLYESQKEANKDLAQVIFWSTTLVGAFLLTIAGSQIFFNFRLRRADIEAIQKTNSKQISDSIASAMTELLKITKDNESEGRSSREELSKYVSGRIDALSERIDTANARIDVVGKKLETLEPLAEKVSTLDIRLSEAEGHIWRLRGVESNALTGFIKSCELLIGNNRPKTLFYGLKEVEAALSKMKDIFSQDYERLVALMQDVPKELHEERDRIVAIYEKLPVYEFDMPDDPRERAAWRYVKNAPGDSKR